MDFGSANIAIYGLGAVAIFGGLFAIIQKFLHKPGNKNIQSTIDEITKQKEIKQISKEQQIIEKQIKESEKTSEETKQKIKKHLRKVAVEIQKTLREDSIEEIQKEMEKDWEDM